MNIYFEFHEKKATTFKGVLDYSKVIKILKTAKTSKSK